MAYVLEKRIVLVLREVGPDADIVLAGDADDVVNGSDVIVDELPRFRAPGRAETWSHRQSHRGRR